MKGTHIDAEVRFQSAVMAVQDRRQIKLELTPQAKARVEKLCDSFNIKQFAMASLVFEWFADAPESLQRGILGMYGDRGEEIIREAYEHFLNPPPPPEPDDPDDPDDPQG